MALGDEDVRSSVGLRAQWDQAEATIAEWERTYDMPNAWARAQLEIADTLIRFVEQMEDEHG